jgi:DNA-binding response OmpR family regulator
MDKVLIIEDDRVIRHLYKVILGRSLHVLECDNGRDGLDCARREHPEIIVLDLIMPGELDGLDVLAAIRQDPEMNDTYIIILTGQSDSKVRDQAMALGANAYFIKPFSPLTLLSHIRVRLATA